MQKCYYVSFISRHHRMGLQSKNIHTLTPMTFEFIATRIGTFAKFGGKGSLII